MEKNNDKDYLEYQSDEEQDSQNGKPKGEFGGQLNQPGYVGIHSTGFKDFLLSEQLMRAIADAGFEHPSEVQQEAIPSAINGSDILCQAKSGMGKTAVFVLSILHRLKSNPQPLSALILCHTRELAYQITKEFTRLGKYMTEIQSRVFYGGDSIEDQKKVLKNSPPHIVIGTPGRMLHLIKIGYIEMKNLKFFVLDECDKMLSQLDMRGDVQAIFKQTPHDKQVMMFSATLSKEKDIRGVCRKFMQNQIEIFIDDETKLTLHGLQQYYLNIQEIEKNRKLSDLLDALVFNQVIIFVKSKKRAFALDKILKELGFPSTTIHSEMPQEERIQRYSAFKEFQQRIMVATDIFARGIDIERVNIVINYDMPESSDIYLHRVGRAGRFGTKGLAITFVSTQDEKKILDEIQSRFDVHIAQLPESIDTSEYMNN